MKKISVIIAAYNAEKTIVNCILSLKKQVYPQFEIIVVNDGSTDNTKKILEKIKGIKIISQKNKGPGAARNLGAKKARGDILVFTDSDCEARDKFWLRNISSVFNKDNKIAAVASCYNGSVGKKFIEEYAFLELVYRLKNMPHEVSTAPSSNISCRKGIFIEIGGFPEQKKFIFAEDILFSYNMSRMGKIIWKKELGIYHKFRTTLHEYLKQQEGFTKSTIGLFLNYPNLLFNVTHHSITVYVEIFLTFILLLNLLASFFMSGFLILSFGLVFGIILLNVNFLIFLKKKRNYIFLIKSAFVIFARNIAYISGMFKGLLKCMMFVGINN